MSLVLHQHPFASYCQKALVALYELDVPFTTHLVDDADARAELAATLWPMAGIPVLRDESADLTLPESTTIIEYLDDVAAGGPKLIPADRADALQARLWDRFFDQHVATPMQKIVGDSLRCEGRDDPEGVVEARSTLDTAYTVLDAQLADRTWATGAVFTLADCAAAPALFYARAVHRWDQDGQPNVTRYYRDLMARPSVARVVDEARPWRDIFPLPWPADMDELHPVPD
ncbi:MAG: glutathione S-transferase [Solirubrobacteraceae bacterium]|nr:glutathione S-transferase [Solirubrobacteraceae bacterium]